MKDLFQTILHHHREEVFLLCISLALAICSTLFFFFQGDILAYGDAESHINIAKRVVDSLTPGLAQLGGIWLPLPHVLMLPFVFIDVLWRTGFAGSIVGGICYITAAIYIYKVTLLVTHNKFSSYAAFGVFALNPNILYLQSTPMSELPLIAFFVLSIYCFINFLYNDKKIIYLISAAFFGFGASLSRYDGWFLVLFELICLSIYYIRKRNFTELEGKAVLFATLAFFGILLWFAWDFLILGDPLYFSNSPFSAKSQQQGWLARGELPTYKNIFLSFAYYFDTSLHTIGLLIVIPVILSFCLFFFQKKIHHKFFIFVLLFVPFIFYWLTLFLGQSVIFIPDLTPHTFQWTLFNVRYGVMMIPFAAFFFGLLFSQKITLFEKILIACLIMQTILFVSGKESTITLLDGTNGLSSSKKVDATAWMLHHYDNGLVLLDDYARTMSIIKSGLPMEKVIYIGNKPYWEESLHQPEKYAKWIVLQKGDSVWNSLYENANQRGRLFKYFQKVYTSPEILIFKRNPSVIASK